MKRFILASVGTCVAGLVLGLPGCHRTPTTTQAEERPDLRTELEAAYATYLQAIRSEDAEMLCSVLPVARIRDLKQVFELNGMVFPRDYFTVFKKHSPVLPPLEEFRYVGTTQADPYANLVYVGDMQGYLRQTRSVQRFLVIQFEKEPDGWKYAVIVDPPVEIVPDWERKLADGQLDFLQSRPFKAERIELRP